jgi:carbamoyl-phosphate synthase large subunit
MTTVLVSGVGQVIGYGVARALRLARTDIRVIGTDIHDHAVGQVWCDAFHQAPLAASAQFEPFLAGLVEREAVSLILSGFPQEIPVLQRLRPDLEEAGASVCLNSDLAIAWGNDKWRLAQDLSSAGVETIPTLLLDAAATFEELSQRLDAPFFVKPRLGSSSKGVALVSTAGELSAAVPMMDGTFIAQRRIGGVDDEFTASIHGDGEGRYTAAIVMRRWLGAGGNTVRAEVVDPDIFRSQFDAVSALAKPLGPTNLQFRLEAGKPYLLEINPRFSSSTYMRALCGYNEAGMVLEHFIDGRLPVQPEIRKLRLVRYAEDVII